MDSTQRFTEDNDYIGYEVDFWVMDILQSLSSDVARNIQAQIENNYLDLKKVNGWSQYIGGVVKGKNPYFFEIEFLNEIGTVPIFLDIQPIDVDKYLDYITNKQALKTYE